MEMLRTIVVALVFAGITVCTYYYLNSSKFPWEMADPGEKVAQTSENPNGLPAPALNDSGAGTYSQDGPFAPLPASMDEGDEFSLPGMNELPPAQGANSAPEYTNISEETPMVAASTAQLPTPPISDNDLPALNDQQSLSPFDSSPAPVQAEHQGQIGSNADVDATQALPSPDEAMDLDLPPAPSLETSPGTDLPAPAPIQEPPVSNPNTNPTPGMMTNPTPGTMTNPTPGTMTNPLRQSSPAPVPAIPAPSAAPSSISGASTPNISNPAPSSPASAAPAAAPAPNQADADADAETAAIREYLKIAAEKIQNGEALEVLRQLSKFYGNPRFTAEESSELVNILVLAAREVIYSQKSFLDPPYVVQPGDTVEKISAEYNIPPEFIILVNGLQPGAPLQAGTQLKVIRGPFHVLVYLDRHEMLLTLNGLFAGRFWIGIGGELIQKDSDFSFAGKSFAQTGATPMPCCDFNLSTGEPGSAQTMKIQACADPDAIGSSAPTGAILMSMADVQSLGAILGPKSQLLMRCHSLKPVPQQTAAETAPGTVPSASVPAPAPAPAYGSAPAPAYGSSAELPNSLPNSLPDSLPGTAPAPAAAPAAEEVPFELPATL